MTEGSMGRDRLVDQIAQTVWRIEECDIDQIAVWWNELPVFQREGYRHAAREVLEIVERYVEPASSPVSPDEPGSVEEQEPGHVTELHYEWATGAALVSCSCGWTDSVVRSLGAAQRRREEHAAGLVVTDEETPEAPFETADDGQGEEN